jgi:TetR/AcrR family transcriptional repressor of mexJK operon
LPRDSTAVTVCSNLGERIIHRSANIVRSRPRAGRPSRAQQEQRHDELLEAALTTFLEHGYEATTIDQIAAELGMSKRTVYSLYQDKAALFKATVLRAIERYMVSSEELEPLITDDLRESLTAIARCHIKNISREGSLRLQRILNAQAYRFPELSEAAFRHGSSQTIQLLSGLFRRHAATGELDVADPDQMAVIFLSFVVGIPARLMIRGTIPSEEEIERRMLFAIDLLFKGIAAR